MGIVGQSRIAMVAGFFGVVLAFGSWTVGRAPEWAVVLIAVMAGANLGLHIDTVDRQRRRNRREPS